MWPLLTMLACRPAAPVAPTPGAYDSVAIYVVTNRTANPDALAAFPGGPGEPFFAQDVWSADRSWELDYARAVIAIPRDVDPADRGVVEYGSVDPPVLGVQLAITELQRISADDFDAAMRKLGAPATSSTLIYVHGFNVTMDYALFGAAQFVHDVGFHGTPVLFTWPSDGTLAGYSDDEDSAAFSGTFLVSDLKRSDGFSEVDVVAHSMGGRVVMSGLRDLALRNCAHETPLVRELVLAAPDVDRFVFKQLFEDVRRQAARSTLLTNEYDYALEASKQRHSTWTRAVNGTQATRAGQGGSDIIVLHRLDSIDLTPLSSSGLGHGIFATSPVAIADLNALLGQHTPIEQRSSELGHLVARSRTNRKGETMPFWTMEP